MRNAKQEYFGTYIVEENKHNTSDLINGDKSSLSPFSNPF